MPKANLTPHKELNADQSDLIWGAPSIGRVINKSVRATYHLLENKFIPAGKVGGQWVGSRRRLLSIGDPEA
jgi:hypothetical protein